MQIQIVMMQNITWNLMFIMFHAGDINFIKMYKRIL